MLSLLENWPLYFKDLLLVKNPVHNVGVVTLWSKKDLFSNLNCNTIGTCYSLEGVKYILRNLAGNTNIRSLILCGVDLSGSGELIKNIFSKNYDLIANDISSGELDKIISNVEIIDLIGVTDLNEIQNKINSLEKKESYGDAKEIKVKETCNAKRPSENAGFLIHEKNISSAWLKALKLIKEYGVEKKTQYGIGSLEIVNLMIVTTESEERNIPAYLKITKKQIQDYEAQIGTGKQIKSVEYTYGQRLCNHFGFDQIEWAINELKKSKESRRIFLTLWDPLKDSKSSLPPCLTSAQFLVQNDSLYLTAYFRSHDLFGGYLLNTFGLQKILERAAKEVGLNVGNLTTISSSAHIYYNDLNSAEEIIKKGLELDCTPDPRGYFFIEVKDKIYAKYLDNSGQPIKIYSGLSAKEVYNQLVLDFSVSQLAHAFYLGGELRNAEIALSKGLCYIQDQNLNI